MKDYFEYKFSQHTLGLYNIASFTCFKRLQGDSSDKEIRRQRWSQAASHGRQWYRRQCCWNCASATHDCSRRSITALQSGVIAIQHHLRQTPMVTVRKFVCISKNRLVHRMPTCNATESIILQITVVIEKR